MVRNTHLYVIQDFMSSQDPSVTELDTLTHCCPVSGGEYAWVSPLCARPEDTVEHTVEVCPAWAEHRRVLVEDIGGSNLSRRAVAGGRLLLRSSNASEGGRPRVREGTALTPPPPRSRSQFPTTG
ncbi:hypothetical protein PYW07_001882 [Mythimna separata]|uniref:Uncharacterized protein n=1 Tax=Mythimna separata TaxID=271217 RepID=A0AAD7YUR2_MYTSE|nr:hypothetical protein PYW07_001882 [Mythimna separata]